MDPFTIVAGLAGIVGLGKHADAEKKKKKTKKKIKEGKRIYNSAKNDYDNALQLSRQMLEQYGLYKNFVMNTTAKKFYHVAQKIMHTEMIASNTEDELSSLMIKPEEIDSLYSVTLQYDSQIVNAGKGAALGAVLLAASGSGSTTSAIASIPSGAFLAGEIEFGASAASILGPAATILGPAMFFVGTSELNEARENLSNAKTFKAKAEAAAEKMRTEIVKFEAVKKWSNLQNEQLRKVNQLFAAAVDMLDVVVKRRTGLANSIYSTEFIDVDELSENERDLIAVTYALAHWIQTIIEAPLLSKVDITVSEELQEQYELRNDKIPQVEARVNNAERIGFPKQELARIYSESTEVQTIDPKSERAQQLIAEAEQFESYYTEEVTEEEKNTEVESETSDNIVATNEETKPFNLKIIFVIVLVIGAFALYQFLDSPSKSASEQKRNVTVIESKNETSTNSKEQIEPQKQQEDFPELSKVTDTKNGFVFLAPPSGVKSDFQSSNSRNTYQLLNGKINVLCEAVTIPSNNLEQEYHNILNDNAVKVLESDQKDNWYYSVSENNASKMIIAKKYYFGDTMKQGVTIQSDAEQYSKPEIRKALKEILDGFTPTVKPPINPKDKLDDKQLNDNNSQDTVDKKDNADSKSINKTSNADSVMKMKSHTDSGLGVSFVYPGNITLDIKGSGLDRLGQINFADKCFINIYMENAVRNNINDIINYEKQGLRYYRDASINEIPSNGYELRYYDDSRYFHVIDKVYLVGNKTKHMRFIYTGEESQEIMSIAQKILDSFSVQ